MIHIDLRDYTNNVHEMITINDELWETDDMEKQVKYLVAMLRNARAEAIAKQQSQD